MGKINSHPPVKLIAGFIFAREAILKQVLVILEKRFGPLDFKSQTLKFEHTDYYQKELGRNLKRVFVSFKKLIRPERISEIKIITNSIENQFSRNKRRKINIDPGYLGLSKLVLASSKDYKHRIYLKAGIYAENTLYYQNKTFKSWECTYPDYRTPDYIDIFNHIRQIYAQQFKIL